MGLTKRETAKRAKELLQKEGVELTILTVEKCIEAFMEVVKEEVLERGQKITLSGYGTFHRAKRISPKKKLLWEYVRFTPTRLKRLIERN